MHKEKFWYNDPQSITSSTYIFPSLEYSPEINLNIISKYVLIISGLGFLITSNFLFLIFGALSLLFIVYTYTNGVQFKEDFSLPCSKEININTSKKFNKEILKQFHPITPKNPFGNVLVTDIMDDPTRKSAPPAFNKIVNKNIVKAVKQGVQDMNPDMPYSSAKLYGNKWGETQLDTYLRQFYSMPSTQVPDSQATFAKLLYGNMKSCKGGDKMACEDNTFAQLIPANKKQLI